ncbi:MAG TPA: transposase family protein [Acidimicrobiales bacterium]|nr:transposase family protein [Acidimicrobiales bacterium]
MRDAVPALLSSLIDQVDGHAGVPDKPVRLGRTGHQVLVAALAQVPDPRDRRGVRHPAPAVLALAIAAVLAGSRSFYAIGQWIAGAGQKTLQAAGARRDPGSGRYVGPDEKTVRGLVRPRRRRRVGCGLGRVGGPPGGVGPGGEGAHQTQAAQGSLGPPAGQGRRAAPGAGQ